MPKFAQTMCIDSGSEGENIEQSSGGEYGKKRKIPKLEPDFEYTTIEDIDVNYYEEWTI